MTMTVHQLDITRIEPHPNNPRRALGNLTELADSIKSVGVLQPITVVPHPNDVAAYRCLLGHRRLAASTLADQGFVPAIIREDLSESDQVVEMGMENIHRADLSPVEEASWLQGILDLGQVKRSKLHQVTGLSKTTISSRLKLGALPDAAKQKVHEGQATLEDAMRLADAEEILDPDGYTAVAAALGTPQFKWELTDKIQAANTARQRAGIVVQLGELGVTVFESIANRDGEWKYLGAFPGGRVDVADLTPDMVAAPRAYGNDFDIYRPATDEDRAAGSTKKPVWEAAQEEHQRQDCDLTIYMAGLDGPPLRPGRYRVTRTPLGGYQWTVLS